MLFLLAAICLLNGSYFFVKYLQIGSGFGKRNPAVAEKFVHRHIPARSKVVGDPAFYYAVAGAGSDLQYLNLYNDLPVRAQIHREIYDYDYLLVSENLRLRYPDDVAYYCAHAQFDTVAVLKYSGNPLNRFVNGLSLVSATEEYGYACILLKRKK